MSVSHIIEVSIDAVCEMKHFEIKYLILKLGLNIQFRNKKLLNLTNFEIKILNFEIFYFTVSDFYDILC